MTPMPEHESSRADSALTDRIAALMKLLGGKTAVAAHRVALPQRGPREAMSKADTLDIRADQEMPAASLAKLPLAIELFRRADLGQFELSERCDTSSEPRAGGGGALDYLDPSVQLTVNDLCFLMLALSDNTAANYLLSLVGMGEVNHTVERLNLSHTRLGRRFMDMAARAPRRDNITCASDMVALLALLRGGAIPGAARLREILSTQQLGEDLAAWLPASAGLAHKTGSLDDAFHDAGILSGPAGSCVYCVMTAEQSDVAAARIAAGRVLRVLWDEWCAGG